MDPHYGTKISPTDSPLKKGAWSPEEDQKLIAYIRRYGIWNWTLMPTAAGLCRSGKSCRLRWMNYLRPGIKRGNFSKEEDETIIELHQKLGTRWSAIAASLPGRTDNEIKNYWHTHLKKRLEDSNNNSSQITSDFSLHISAPISPASPGGSCASTRNINGCSLDFTQLQSVGCNPFTMENFGYWLEDQNHETTFGDSQFGLPTLQELQEPTYSHGSNNFGCCVEDQNQETTFGDSEFGLPTPQGQQGPMYSYGSSTFDEEDELWLKCLIDADMTGISWPLYS